MYRVFAIFNQSGGVGKTSLTQNIGYQLALKNRVLLIDMDPQGTLSTFIGLSPQTLDAKTQTIYGSLVHREPLPIQYQIHGVSSLDAIPANVQLSSVEAGLSSVIMKELRLKQALSEIKGKYDFILIDCPPSLSLHSIFALVAASHVLIPIETHYKSLEGTNLLLQTISEVRQVANPQLSIAGFIPTKFANTKEDRQTLDEMQPLAQAARVFDPIPKATAFPAASRRHLPLQMFEPGHKAIEVLKEIAQAMEVLA